MRLDEGGTVVEGCGVVEAVMSVTDGGLSGEVDFAVDRGSTSGFVRDYRREVVVRWC